MATNKNLTFHRYMRLMGLATIEIACTIPLANHVSELEVLRLQITLHTFHAIDSLLRRVGFELELLEL